MNYWLLKSEPNNWSWTDQVKVKKTMWDGVRNFQARNNMMMMMKKDQCFFYHSVVEKKIIGIVTVVREHYPDPTDKTNKFVVVDVKTEKKFIKAVTLLEIKQEKKLIDIALIKQSRLSVMPIDIKSWKIICKMGGL